MDFETGQIVFSKCGHDKTLPFIVTAVDGEYLYLADGKSRRLEHPKRKKSSMYKEQNMSARI